MDRYKRAVADLHHLFQVHGGSQVKRLSFSDYQHISLSPVRSSDLLKAFEDYKKNLFYPYFSDRLRIVLEKNWSKFRRFFPQLPKPGIMYLAIIGFIKKQCQVKVILGGSLVTSWMRINAWKNQFKGIIGFMLFPVQRTSASFNLVCQHKSINIIIPPFTSFLSMNT